MPGILYNNIIPLGKKATECVIDLIADGLHLLEVGDPIEDLGNAVLHKGYHAFLNREGLQLLQEDTVDDGLFDQVGGDQQLVESAPALVAGVFALSQLSPGLYSFKSSL